MKLIEYPTIGLLHALHQHALHWSLVVHIRVTIGIVVAVLEPERQEYYYIQRVLNADTVRLYSDADSDGAHS